MEVRASDRAVRYIRKRGGAVYLWVSEDGMLRHATDAPAELSFRRVRGPEFALFLQKGLGLGERVGFERSPFPPWRLLVGFAEMRAYGDGGGGGGW